MSTEFTFSKDGTSANRTSTGKDWRGESQTRMSFSMTVGEWFSMDKEQTVFGSDGWQGSAQEFWETEANNCTTVEFRTQSRN